MPTLTDDRASLINLLEAVDSDAAEAQVVIPSGRRVGPIARQFGGWYERGAWRFPSPQKADEFRTALDIAAEMNKERP
jgi:hypothetical protein